MVEQSFGVQMVCVHHTVFELYLREKKEERRTKQTFTFDFLDPENVQWNSGSIF